MRAMEPAWLWELHHGSRHISPFRFRGRLCCPAPSPCSGRRSLAFWHEMTRDMGGPYRPERHYMRGPGPKWRAKHGLPPL